MAVSLFTETDAYQNHLKAEQRKRDDMSFKKGYAAFWECEPMKSNPHFAFMPSYGRWLDGWRKGFNEFITAYSKKDEKKPNG